MGRSHPLGIIFASLLFGALTQGGAEFAFEMPKIQSEMIIVIQALVILFAGAFENMFRPALSKIFNKISLWKTSFNYFTSNIRIYLTTCTFALKFAIV